MRRYIGAVAMAEMQFPHASRSSASAVAMFAPTFDRKTEASVSPAPACPGSQGCASASIFVLASISRAM